MIFIKPIKSTLTEMLYRTQNSPIQIKGHGHTLSSWDLPFIFASAPDLQGRLNDFH